MALNYSITGKRILVTGGAQGLGRQLVQRFYDGGAKVFVIDKNAEVMSQLEKDLPGVTAKVVDMANWADTRKMVESIGVLDHVVNNAAVAIWQPFLEVTEDAVALQHNVNFGAVVNISQVAAKAMIAAQVKGTIVNISSITCRKMLTGLSCYGSLKGGLTTLTKYMAVELGQHGIRVNCVEPGVIDTPVNYGPDGKILERAQGFIDGTVMKRIIDPDEIADLVLFLLSPLSKSITGEAVDISAGWI